MADALATRMDDARSAHGKERCSCGDKLTTPSEVLTGVCVFCQTPEHRDIATRHYDLAERAAWEATP